MAAMTKEQIEKIFAAFEDGDGPVEVVINFKLPFDVVRKLYEEYVQSKGGRVVWGDTVQKLEKALGRKLKSSEDFMNGMLELRQLVNEIYTEVFKAMGDKYTPPEETLKEIAIILKKVDPGEVRQVTETLKALNILSRRRWQRPVEPTN